LTVAICEFTAGQKINDKKTLEFNATYFVGFESGDGDMAEDARREFVEELVSANAWPMFRDLFIHMGSQTGEELPLLPNVPTLRWMNSEEEESPAT
jgi:hypothetical protein